MCGNVIIHRRHSHCGGASAEMKVVNWIHNNTIRLSQYTRVPNSAKTNNMNSDEMFIFRFNILSESNKDAQLQVPNVIIYNLYV